MFFCLCRLLLLLLIFFFFCIVTEYKSINNIYTGSPKVFASLIGIKCRWIVKNTGFKWVYKKLELKIPKILVVVTQHLSQLIFKPTLLERSFIVLNSFQYFLTLFPKISALSLRYLFSVKLHFYSTLIIIKVYLDGVSILTTYGTTV